MHRQREDGACREDEAVEIDGYLIRIEDRDEGNRGEPPDERGGGEFKCNGSAGTWASMAFREMAMTVGTGRQLRDCRLEIGPRRDRTFDNLVKSQVLYH